MENSISQHVHFCFSAYKGKEEKQAVFLLALSGVYFQSLAKILIV
jgi:hypothetical protein